MFDYDGYRCRRQGALIIPNVIQIFRRTLGARILCRDISLPLPPIRDLSLTVLEHGREEAAVAAAAGFPTSSSSSPPSSAGGR